MCTRKDTKGQEALLPGSLREEGAAQLAGDNTLLWLRALPFPASQQPGSIAELVLE